MRIKNFKNPLNKKNSRSNLIKILKNKIHQKILKLKNLMILNSKNKNPYVIAEAGVNHNGNYNLAKN